MVFINPKEFYILLKSANGRVREGLNDSLPIGVASR
jgi:hypothetical protein